MAMQFEDSKNSRKRKKNIQADESLYKIIEGWVSLNRKHMVIDILKENEK